MSFVLDYSLQRIDRDIPSFHKELLTAWQRHKDHHLRTGSPVAFSRLSVVGDERKKGKRKNEGGVRRGLVLPRFSPAHFARPQEPRAWNRLDPLSRVTDTLNEPVFLNLAITTEDKPLIFTDWFAAGRIRNI